MLELLVDPTAANLPFWSIGILVGAVSVLFSILLTLMREIAKEKKELQDQLDLSRKEHLQKLEALYKENLEDQKAMAVLLNDNIQLIQSLTEQT